MRNRRIAVIATGMSLVLPLLSTTASAATIVEVLATDPISIFAQYGGTCSPPCERGQAVGWSQTGVFTDVLVEVDLLNLNGGFDSDIAGTGHAYLMRQIGPGTSVAQQVAFTTFAGLPDNALLGWTTLFTGLTLGPGSYYIVLGSNGTSSGGWAVDLTPTISTGPGVALQTRFLINGDHSPSNPDFLPGEDIENFAGWMPFRVTGETRTRIPEPATIGLLGIALLVGIKRARRT